MKIEAKEKLKTKGIKWHEKYTDKTEYLKEQFHEVVGPGSYFRFEGKAQKDGSEYYVIISPARIHEPIAKWFAGVRKMPATFSASGKYFETMSEAFSYAANTWGVSKPKSARPYSSRHLKGIKHRIDKWKEKNDLQDDLKDEEDMKKSEVEAKSMTQVKVAQIKEGMFNPLDRLFKMTIADEGTFLLDADLLPQPKYPEIKTEASLKLYFNLKKSLTKYAGSLPRAQRKQIEYYAIDDLLDSSSDFHWRKVWSEYFTYDGKVDPIIERTLYGNLSFLARKFYDKKKELMNQYKFKKNVVEKIYSGAVGYSPQYGMYIMAFGPYAGEKAEGQLKWGIFTKRSCGINTQLMKKLMSDALTGFAKDFEIDLLPEDFGFSLEGFIDGQVDDKHGMPHLGEGNITEKTSEPLKYYESVNVKSAPDLYATRCIPNKYSKVVINNKGALKIIRNIISKAPSLGAVYRQELEAMARRDNVTPEEMEMRIAGQNMPINQEMNHLHRIFQALFAKVRSEMETPNTEIYNISQNSPALKGILDKMFNPKQEFQKQIDKGIPQFSSTIKLPNQDYFSALIATATMRSDAAFNYQMASTIGDLMAKNKQVPTLQEVIVEINQSPKLRKLLKSKIEDLYSSGISRVMPYEISKKYKSQLDNFFSDASDIEEEASDREEVADFEARKAELETMDIVNEENAGPTYERVKQDLLSGETIQSIIESYDKIYEGLETKTAPQRGSERIYGSITEREYINRKFKTRIVQYIEFAKDHGLIDVNADLSDPAVQDEIYTQMGNAKEKIQQAIDPKGKTLIIQNAVIGSMFVDEVAGTKGPKPTYNFGLKLPRKVFNELISSIARDLTEISAEEYITNSKSIMSSSLMDAMGKLQHFAEVYAGNHYEESELEAIALDLVGESGKRLAERFKEKIKPQPGRKIENLSDAEINAIIRLIGNRLASEGSQTVAFEDNISCKKSATIQATHDTISLRSVGIVKSASMADPLRRVSFYSKPLGVDELAQGEALILEEDGEPIDEMGNLDELGELNGDGIEGEETEGVDGSEFDFDIEDDDEADSDFPIVDEPMAENFPIEEVEPQDESIQNFPIEVIPSPAQPPAQTPAVETDDLDGLDDLDDFDIEDFLAGELDKDDKK